VPYEPSLPVYTTWDLGVGDSTAIWFWQASGAEIRVIDYYEANGHGIDHYAKVLQAKPYRYEHDFVPHDAKVREFGTGRTRIETMMALNLKPKLVPMHKVMDGINALRVLFPRIYWDREKCRDGLEALRQYRSEFDDKARVFRDNPKHDWTSHAADAARYLGMAYREIKPSPVEAKKPLKGVQDMTWNDLMDMQQPTRRERA
jgi:hypothetical protein